MGDIFLLNLRLTGFSFCLFGFSKFCLECTKLLFGSLKLQVTKLIDQTPESGSSIVSSPVTPQRLWTRSSQLRRWRWSSMGLRNALPMPPNEKSHFGATRITNQNMPFHPFLLESLQISTKMLLDHVVNRPDCQDCMSGNHVNGSWIHLTQSWLYLGTPPLCLPPYRPLKTPEESIESHSLQIDGRPPLWYLVKHLDLSS